jgi:hypothetical protein
MADNGYGPTLDTRAGSYLIRLVGGKTCGPFDCDDLAEREALVRWAFKRFGTPPEGYRLDAYGDCSALNLSAVRALVRAAGGDVVIERPRTASRPGEVVIFYADGRSEQLRGELVGPEYVSDWNTPTALLRDLGQRFASEERTFDLGFRNPPYGRR